MRDENTELKKRINDFSSVENAKKKLEAKVETLEQKVSSTDLIIWRQTNLIQDGHTHSRQGVSKGQRTNSYL